MDPPLQPSPTVNPLVRPREESQPEHVLIPESPSGETGSQDMLGLETGNEQGSEVGEEDDGAAFSAFLSGDTTALHASKDSIKHPIVVLRGGALRDGLNRALFGGGRLSRESLLYVLSCVSDQHIGKGCHIVQSPADARTHGYPEIGGDGGNAVVAKCYIRAKASAEDRVYISPTVGWACEPPYTIRLTGKYLVATPHEVSLARIWLSPEGASACMPSFTSPQKKQR